MMTTHANTELSTNVAIYLEKMQFFAQHQPWTTRVNLCVSFYNLLCQPTEESVYHVESHIGQEYCCMKPTVLKGTSRFVSVELTSNNGAGSNYSLMIEFL